jgi:predicted transposase YdaD
MTDSPPTPHDALVKALLEAPERAAVVLRENLPETVRDRLSDDLPEPLPGSYVDEYLAESHSDQLFRARTTDDRPVFIYVLVEHKSEPDPGTPVQILGYMHRIWRRYAEQSGDGRAERYRNLPPIVPLVLYNGRPAWSVPLSLVQCIDADDDLRELQRDFGYSVRHLRAEESVKSYSEDPIVRTIFSALAQAYVRDLDRDDVIELLEGLPSGHPLERPLLVYIVAAYGPINKEDIEQAIEHTRPDRAKELVMTAAEQWIQQGERKGRQAEGSELLLLQLQAKFDSTTVERYRERVERANEAAIRTWSIRLLTAETIDAVFADG